MEQMKRAIALQYPEGAEAPFIALNVRGAIAEKVLRIAQEKNIPVERNAVLAQTLSMCQVGSYIPEETYEVLAKIFAFIKKREDEHAGA